MLCGIGSVLADLRALKSRPLSFLDGPLDTMDPLTLQRCMVHDDNRIDTTTITGRSGMGDSERHVLGKYRSSFRAIHRALLQHLCDKHAIEYRRMQMPIYQISVRDYMNSRCGQAYTCMVYELRTPGLDPKDAGSTGRIVVAVNARYRACLYQHRYIHRLICSCLVEAWRSIRRVRLRFVSEGESYPRDADDTIEAVGFLCDGERLFEILYPSHLIKSLFELVSARSRRGTPSTNA